MDDLIEALQIFRKYANEKWPTVCEHDVMYIVNVHANDVSEEDIEKLYELGFFWDDENESFESFKFGSA